MNAREFVEHHEAHEPTKRWHDVIRKYTKLSNYKRALDIGTASGLSAWVLSESGDGKIDTVDIRKDVQLDRISKEYKFEDRIKRFQMTSDEFFKQNKNRYQIVLVDGCHGYDEVKRDIMNAWEVLDEGGYIVCDDYNNYNGTHRAIDDVPLSGRTEESDRVIFHK